MRKTVHIAVAILMMVGFVACSGGKSVTKTSGGKDGTLTEPERMQVTTWFHEATKEKVLGNYETSIKLLKRALDVDPACHACMYELAGIVDFQGDYAAAQIYNEKAVELNGKNLWYRRQLAAIYTHQGKLGLAAEEFEVIHKAEPDNADDLYDWAAVLTYDKRFEDAVGVYDKLENIVGNDAQLTLEKHRLYLEAGKPEKATAVLKNYLETDANNTEVMTMLADLYLRAEEQDKAMALYERIKEIDPDNGVVHLALADYYEQQGNRTKSQDELRLAYKSQTLDPEIKTNILLSYYNGSFDNPEIVPFALELADLFIENHPKNAQAYSLRADFNYRQEKIDLAVVDYRKAV